MSFELEKKFSDKTIAFDDTGKSLSLEDYHYVKETFGRLMEPRSVVFVYSKNCNEALAAFLVCMELKIIPLMLDAKMDATLRNQLEHTYRPQYLWMPESDKTLKDKNPVFSWRSYQLIKTGKHAYPVFEQLSLLLTTSGSTGSPKLVRHSYENIYRNAVNVAAAFDIVPDDRPLAFLPLQYTMGLSLVCSHLMAGATVHLTDRAITEGDFWERVKNEQITNLTGVPFSYAWFKRLRLERMDLPHLKVLSQGGGKLDEKLFKAFAEYCRNTNKKFIASYGQTEASARMSVLEGDMAIEKAGSIGKPIPEGRFSIRDDNGNISTEGEAQGELIYEGPNVTLGYAHNIDDLAKGDERNGYLETNDIAYRDADGFYYIKGRMSRFLKIYGLRISMDEVEAMVSGKFDTDCMVSGRDDEMSITVTGTQDEKAIKTHIAQTLNVHHSAIQVKHVQHIERNSAGKILYK
jgi:acyl-coenzyme A synthetase/AMP-(fatty) acid ligase